MFIGRLLNILGGGAAEEALAPLKWFAAVVMVAMLKRTSSPLIDSTSACVLLSEVDSNAVRMALTLDVTSVRWSVRYLIQAAFCAFCFGNIAAFFGIVCHKCVTCNQSQTIHLLLTNHKRVTENGASYLMVNRL